MVAKLLLGERGRIHICIKLNGSFKLLEILEHVSHAPVGLGSGRDVTVCRTLLVEVNRAKRCHANACKWLVSLKPTGSLAQRLVGCGSVNNKLVDDVGRPTVRNRNPGKL